MSALLASVCLSLLSVSQAQIFRPPPAGPRPPPPPPFQPPPCSYLTGGATSIVSNQTAGGSSYATAGFGFDVVTTYNHSLSLTAFGRYYAPGSGVGIASLTNSSYCTSFSDAPMTVIQEATFDAKFPRISGSSEKLTIPTVLSAYGFWVNAGTKTIVTINGVKKSTQVLRLTARDVYYIYWGTNSTKNYTWGYTGFESAPNTTVKNKTDAAFLASQIRPYSSSANSGTTFLVKTLFQAALGQKNKFIDAAVLPLSSAVFPSKWTTSKYLATGSISMCTTAASILGAMTYSQKFFCSNRLPLIEVNVLNKAGAYIASTGPNVTASQAIPIAFPAYDQSWSLVTLVYQNGLATPPLVSFIYFFIRKRYQAAQLNVTKKLGLYLTSTSSTLASLIPKNGLEVIDPNIMAKSNAAIQAGVGL